MWETQIWPKKVQIRPLCLRSTLLASATRTTSLLIFNPAEVVGRRRRRLQGLGLLLGLVTTSVFSTPG
jgi:hypothetical protein